MSESTNIFDWPIPTLEKPSTLDFEQNALFRKSDTFQLNRRSRKHVFNTNEQQHIQYKMLRFTHFFQLSNTPSFIVDASASMDYEVDYHY